jgi:hypothetical protein
MLLLLLPLMAPALAAPAPADRVEILGTAPDDIRKEFLTADGRHVAWLAGPPGREVLTLEGHADPFFGAVKSAPVISSDGRRMAYKVDADGGAKRAVAADGALGPAYDSVNNASIRFSADSRHLDYSAADGHGQTVLVRDGKPMAQGADIRSDAVTSDDFRHVAYKVAVGNRRAVVLDGRPGPAFPQVDNDSMAFSADGERLVYLARDGQGDNAKATVVLDQTPGETYDRVTGVTFSADGRHLAYVAARGGQECVVLDGKPGPACESIDPYFLRFTPGGSVGYRACGGGRMRLMVGDGTVGEAGGILDWSAAGQRTAFIAAAGESWWVETDGRKSEPYSRVAAPLAISPDGAHLAYAAQKGGQWLVVFDAQPATAWDRVAAPPVFSADGSHWSFVAERRGQWFVVVDGRPHGPYDWFLWGGPQFSPDGRHVAFAARAHNRWQVVLDDRTAAEGDDLSASPLRFSPDGRHFACAMAQGGAWRVVVDGEPGPAFDRLFDRVPEFLADGSLEYPALRGKTLYRVTHAP